MPKTDTPPSRRGLRVAQGKGAPTLLRREVVHRVFIPVNEAEIPGLSLELCAALQKDQELEAQAKQIASEFKESRKEQQVIADQLREKITRGNVEEMPCVEIKDFKAMTVRYIRMDTNEQVEIRPLTEEDEQMNLGEAPSEDLGGNESPDNGD